METTFVEFTLAETIDMALFRKYGDYIILLLVILVLILLLIIFTDIHVAKIDHDVKHTVLTNTKSYLL